MAVDLTRDQALDLLRRFSQAEVRSSRADLTARQLAILLAVYMSPPPHTVRGLAAEFDLRKPAVSRALDRLSILGLVRRRRDPDDRRSVLVQRTVKGAVHVSDLGETFRRAAK
jgi:DNA-binding MarR family transcriptional regulator